MAKILQDDVHPVAVDFNETDVLITLSDGRKIGTPLHWHPWLEAATSEQREKYEFYTDAVFWPDLDDGLDIEAILRGIMPKHLRPITE